ncbi:MAG: radical SAM protein [Thermodesulfobacteriota bacterium]
MDAELKELLAEAGRVSRQRHGPELAIHLPGMFRAYGRRGRYPAASITGPHCRQNCAHCGGRLLQTMHPAATPEELLALGRRLDAAGMAGLLISGGSDPTGRMPWAPLIPAIAELAATTRLILTAHVGRIDRATAAALKAAGVRQALYDVVGDPATAREILNLPDGLAAQAETLDACQAAGLELVPHVIIGLHHGRMLGEERALEIVAGLNPRRVVFIVLMPLKHTGLAGAEPPAPAEAARFIARARLRLPAARHHLGCARPRGRYRQELDALAVAAGINVLAIPSDAARAAAEELGRPVSLAETCCSLA